MELLVGCVHSLKWLYNVYLLKQRRLGFQWIIFSLLFDNSYVHISQLTLVFYTYARKNFQLPMGVQIFLNFVGYNYFLVVMKIKL